MSMLTVCPPCVKVVNFSGAVSVPQGGCWRLLSLQLLNRSLPLNLLSTLTLTTDLCLALKLPLYFHSTLDKVILPMTPVCIHIMYTAPWPR